MTWTQAELDDFDYLVEMASSYGQSDRIRGRLWLTEFMTRHGKEKCDAMYEFLTAKRDASDRQGEAG